MGLLTMDNGQLVIQPELLALPVFEVLWTRSSNDKHAQAIRELTYIYLMYDYDSPFRQYSMFEGVRHTKVLEALGIDSIDVDILLQKAAESYQEMHRTYSMLLLEDAEHALHKLRVYFRDVDLLEVDDKDKPIYKASDLMSNLKNLGAVIKGLKELKAEVEKEQTEKVRIRGGAKVDTDYEKPKQ